MKKKIKTIGLSSSFKLMDVSYFLYDHLPENFVGMFLYDHIAIRIESLGTWLFCVSYNGSEEEIADAINLAFDDDWKSYSETQLKIISSRIGIAPTIGKYDLN